MTEVHTQKSDTREIRVYDPLSSRPLIPPLVIGGMNSFSSDGRFVLAVGKQSMAWEAAGNGRTGPRSLSRLHRREVPGRRAESVRRLTVEPAPRILDLSPIFCSIAELELEAMCLRGQKLDESGGLVPVDATALIDAWERLQSLRVRNSPQPYRERR